MEQDEFLYLLHSLAALLTGVKQDVQLLYAHQVLLEVGVGAHLPGIGVAHQRFKTDWTSLINLGIGRYRFSTFVSGQSATLS